MTPTRTRERLPVRVTADDPAQPYRRWRRIAVVAGLIGAALAVLVPFLPVNQEQASLSWPQPGRSSSVTAPLVSYSPAELTIAVPCSAAASLGAAGGNLLSTIPPQSGQAWHYGLNAVVTPTQNGGRLQIVLRDRTLLDTPTPELPADCRVAVTSDSTRTSVEPA